MSATPSEPVPSDDELAALVVRRGMAGQDLRAAHAAFEQLYRRHARLLSAFLGARVRRDRLDDLNQEVWRRAWDSLPAQYHGGNLRAWLHQIARNALIDQGRKKQAEPLEGREERLDSRDEPPVERLIERERRDALKRCLDRLGTEAAALVKGRLGGEDYAEICARLGIRPERAHKLWHTVKARLRSCVEQDLA
jgi:RNA polymerase sigma factor (sigma-70 family)